MNKKELLERFILEEIMLADNDATIDPDESLIDNGVLDSLGLLRLIAFVEEQFDIEVDDGEVVPDNFQSLNVMDKFLASEELMPLGNKIAVSVPSDTFEPIRQFFNLNANGHYVEGFLR